MRSGINVEAILDDLYASEINVENLIVMGRRDRRETRWNQGEARR